MPLVTHYESMTLPSPTHSSGSEGTAFPSKWMRELTADLKRYFGQEFSLWDGETGDNVFRVPREPAGDEYFRSAMARVVSSRHDPQMLADEDGVLLLAIPVEWEMRRRCVAISAFASRRFAPDDDTARAERLLGLDRQATLAWNEQQTIWTADALERLAAAVVAKRNAECEAERARGEVEKIAENLAGTYEEITLIHGITQNLRISSSDEDTGRFALRMLIESLPVQGAAIQLLPVEASEKATYKARMESALISEGRVPLDNSQFCQLIDHLELMAGSGPFVGNLSITGKPAWPFPEVRQVIIVPLAEGTNLFGWLAAFNNTHGAEFHTVEASLLASVGIMLGIHSGNRELYRRQAELLAGLVRALTSAIDAKDPYTCGHSDRVARIAVRLAKQLDKSPEFLNTIYMAGLLHDVGKIGIDERVLRKPDKLTAEEYEHIKLHPELGYRILVDIHELKDVLPAVLHHHEQWDGKGYPHQLAGENIPEIARIMAVADAYDAMFSSRPYRPGMPEAKVETILRNGAGQQWDARVVDAYFAARDDIREIGRYERANLTLDVQQWS